MALSGLRSSEIELLKEREVLIACQRTACLVQSISDEMSRSLYSGIESRIGALPVIISVWIDGDKFKSPSM